MRDKRCEFVPVTFFSFDSGVDACLHPCEVTFDSAAMKTTLKVIVLELKPIPLERMAICCKIRPVKYSSVVSIIIFILGSTQEVPFQLFTRVLNTRME